MTELFSEKYLPRTVKEYTGFNHQSVLQYVENVISGKEKKKAIIFHGLPGCGKTTLALMLPDHFDLSSHYTNASDARKKKDVNADIFRTSSLQSEKSLIILDEVDGLAKGAFKELERVLKKYNQPTVLICNDLAKIPYSLRSICHIEKFAVDRFTLLALGNRVVKAEGLDLTRPQIKDIIDKSKSYRDVLYGLQFGVTDTYHTEQLSPDLVVLNSLQNQSTVQFPTTNLPDLIIRTNDNSTSPNLISMASLWESRYRGGYTYGKYIVKAILSSIRNPNIKKLQYPRTYSLIHTAKTGKKRVDPVGEKKSSAPKIKIVGFK